MKITTIVGTALACLLSLSACQNPAGGGADAILQVSSTTSFGMCVGYCKTTLDIGPDSAVLTSEPWGRGMDPAAEPRRAEKPLTPDEWREIARLAGAATIDALPDVIGCPDCADGGAESLTIISEQGAKTITFDHGAAIPEAEPLLDRVRALRKSLSEQEN